MKAREMKRSYLVQRLNKPRNRDNPFSFGGGYKNGGLSDEAMSLLRGVFSFDYMGSAEFEFGAVPKALQLIAENQKKLRAFTFSIERAEVPPSWGDNRPAPEGKAKVYVLCHKDDAAIVEERIRTWATESNNTNLKEQTRLSSALRPFNEWDANTCGWLELDNGFMFFTDEEMWSKSAALFGVET